MVVVYATDDELLLDLQKEKEVTEKNKKDQEKNKAAAAGGGGTNDPAAELDLDYYHSGLTPPTTNIVKRRFQETRMHGPYPVCMTSILMPSWAAYGS